ncbi:MAG TPA: hypothetical protein PLO89_02760 [Spirochaetota bacterium]|nr:hypothetical protein [Spirochaetota bacterium]
MKKKILIAFFFFFSFYSVFSVSFSIDKDTQVTILPPKNIANCILYDLLLVEKSYFIAFLTKDKEINFGFLDSSDDSFTIDAVSSIYKYEKADAVEYIDSTASAFSYL